VIITDGIVSVDDAMAGGKSDICDAGHGYSNRGLAG
jgi:hypothetical protein